MASSSGNSSGSPPPPPCSDLRKRKRMQSNRESARRSRQRKQKHLDDLNAQIAQLSKENNQILNAVNAATQHCVKVEAENSVIRAQMMELSQRLQSLNQILNRTTSSSAASAAAAAVGSCMFGFEGDEFQFTEGFFFNNYQQPIMAAAQMFDC